MSEEQEMSETFPPKTIAIDFDDTFTTDPYLWADFIHLARARGHKVICVTARHRTEENLEALEPIRKGLKCPTYFTGHQAKIAYMEAQGVKVDLWIDDNPRVVVHGV